ncbi:MAG: FprA family A-type flavoprotein [Bacilli bacterium]
MEAIKIRDDLFWTGVYDPNLRRFDIVMETKKGSTYNSYVLKGHDKTILIDGSKKGFAAEWLTRINAVVDPKAIDILIVQHTEPDHSSAINDLLEINPEIEIYGSMLAMSILSEIVNRPFHKNIIKEGQILDIGGLTLHFFVTPNIHWPDTIMTYVPERGYLFTCDFFGAHISPQAMLVSELAAEFKDYEAAFSYYYHTIMEPLKPFARKALDRVRDLDIKLILNSHGPIIDESQQIQKSIKLYDQWTTPLTFVNKQVTIVYCSNYGYTRKMALTLNEALKNYPFDVYLFDIIESKQTLMLEKLIQADLVIIGSPTIVADAIHPVYDLLNLLTPFQMQGKKVSAFGSYGWSGEAVPNLLVRAKQLRMLPLDEGLKIRLNPSEADLEKVREYANNLATVLIG